MRRSGKCRRCESAAWPRSSSSPDLSSQSISPATAAPGRARLRAGTTLRPVAAGAAGRVIRTLPALLDDVAARFAPREALVSSRRRMTYGELGAVPVAISNGKGTHVGLLLPNCPEWIAIAFDRPYDLARVSLRLNRWSLGDYPRELSPPRLASASAPCSATSAPAITWLSPRCGASCGGTARRFRGRRRTPSSRRGSTTCWSRSTA